MNTTNTVPRYIAIARALGSMKRCEQSGNSEWQCKHEAAILELCSDLPSGSGFDNGSKLDFDASTAEKLVFTTAFHHMNDGGYYDGWTDHRVTLTPSLEMGFRLSVSGRDRNDIKEYIHEMFASALSARVEEWTGYPKAEIAIAS